MTAEPSGRYLLHFTPEYQEYPEKPAFKVAQALYDIFLKYDSTKSCIVLGGDSTNSNTGWRGGTIAHLERLLGHKCHWVVCNIHTLELPLRHLITGIDGPTNSRDGFQGDRYGRVL